MIRRPVYPSSRWETLLLGAVCFAVIATITVGCSSTPAAASIVVYVTPPPVATGTVIANVTAPSPTAAALPTPIDPTVAPSATAPGMPAATRPLTATNRVIRVALTFPDLAYSTKPLTCTLWGDAENVPELSVYSIEIAGRASFNFTRAELDTSGWLAQVYGSKQQ